LNTSGILNQTDIDMAHAAERTYDVAVVGCGIAGMATALRLQSKGHSTIIIEAHGQPGGCAGFYTRKGFSFDVGATTLVDFDEDGVGGELFQSAGIPLPESEKLDYVLWLPDRSITLYHNKEQWHKERLLKFGDSPDHIAFWKFMDKLANVFWRASRKGIKLPMQSGGDVWNNIQAVGARNLFLCRYLSWNFLDALKKFNLQNDVPLRKAMSMLIEDTVHSSAEDAPLINAALGITIRGAGIRRATGGMKGLWNHLIRHYKQRGGHVFFGNRVADIKSLDNSYLLTTRKRIFRATRVVSALPIDITYDIVDNNVKHKLKRYIDKQEINLGGAIVVFLGVPDEEVTNQHITHHQLLDDYNKNLGNGNNMFISISAKDDILSAPKGFRAVMISTHCSLEDWQNLDERSYELKKQKIGHHLLNLAKRVYPNLGDNAIVFEVGTPSTYHKYTGRKNGAVGGIKQNVRNANQQAIPHDIHVKNFRLAGDTTWPGLGTVACILGSRIVAAGLTK
jgi:C-3',4' desaturase CrtD